MSLVMVCLGIAVGYAGNLAIPQQAVFLLIAGITLALVAFVVLAIRDKDGWDSVLDTLVLDVGAMTFITPKTLSAFWVIVFLCLAVIAFLANDDDSKGHR
jgi:hypothetical protein